MEKLITSKKANTIIVKVLGYAAYMETLYAGKSMTRADIEEDVKNRLLLSLNNLVNENKLPTGVAYKGRHFDPKKKVADGLFF